MKDFSPKKLHAWDPQPRAAIALQKQLSGRVNRKGHVELDMIDTVAGVDTAYRRGSACPSPFAELIICPEIK